MTAAAVSPLHFEVRPAFRSSSSPSSLSLLFSSEAARTGNPSRCAIILLRRFYGLQTPALRFPHLRRSLHSSPSARRSITMPAHTCRWGILSTGWIANKFALDLLIDPATRGVSDVQHHIVAVGSRSVDSAKRFVEETWKGAGVSAGKDQVKLYGSYDQLIADEVRPPCMGRSRGRRQTDRSFYFGAGSIRTSTASTSARHTRTTMRTYTPASPRARTSFARSPSPSTLPRRAP